MPLPSLPLYLQLLKRIRFLTKLDSVSTCKSIATTWGSEPKPTRSDKVELGLMLDFRDGEKPQISQPLYIGDLPRCKNRRVSRYLLW